MAGRYMALEGGSYHQDNAFLMHIGGYVFIEFGKQNNACHVFWADNLPFKFGQKSVLGTRDGLKNKDHPGHRETLTHSEGWQWKFDSFLRYHAKATPAENKPKAVSSPVASYTSPAANPTVQPIPLQRQQATAFDLKQLQAFCAPYNLSIDDHRAEGGALWVRTTETHAMVSTVLKSAGFRYKEGKGWWLA